MFLIIYYIHDVKTIAWHVFFFFLAPSLKMIEHLVIPMSSPNFCLEARDSISKDGIVAILRHFQSKF